MVKDEAGQILMVGQSAAKDEDGNVETVHLILKDRRGQPFARGKYVLVTEADTGTSYATNWEDKFEVI